MIDASTATDGDEQPGNHPAASEPMTDIHERRKADHIRINLEEDVAFKGLTTGLEAYRFMHLSLIHI